MTSLDQVRNSANLAMAEFLLIDAEMALSLLRLADNTGNPETKDRRRRTAVKAYLKIIDLMPRVALTGGQKDSLERKLLIVQSHLNRLGSEQ